MNTEQRDIRDQGKTIAATLKRAELDVATSVEIKAESRRVLHALTIPEYMEAWLQMPDSEKSECSADSRAPNNFHIDFYSSEASHTRIEGFLSSFESGSDHLPMEKYLRWQCCGDNGWYRYKERPRPMHSRSETQWFLQYGGKRVAFPDVAFIPG
jgi:hypothetical protein